MQLLLQKEIFPASALLHWVFQRRDYGVPGDASVWPQECPSREPWGSRTGFSHDIPSRTGVLPMVCGHTLDTTVSNTAPFTFHLSVVPADLPPWGRSCALWHSRSHPTLGKVFTVVAASDVTAATVPLPRCCMQRFSTLPDKSPSTWQWFWAQNPIIFSFPQEMIWWQFKACSLLPN